MSSGSSKSGSLASTRDALAKAYNTSSTSSANLKSQLTKAKIELTQNGLLVPMPQDATSRSQEVVIAREILEIGAFASLKQRDVESFDRYVGLLRVFYNDLGINLPPSKSLEPLLGLSLLRLLSANLISQFHTTLETLPPQLIASSPFIQHPVNLERWLMEGSYSKVWRARQEVPREEYSFFVEELMGTIRHEIASCEEKAYDSLPLGDAATLLFFKNMQEVSEFANERGWQINPTTQTVLFTNKADLATKDALPKKATITSNLQFAKELESIV